jgi:acetyl-CoA acyltransferase
MSGARLALRAAPTLADEGIDFAVATMCVGGGQSVVMLLGRF